jgi:hypothetical protein
MSQNHPKQKKKSFFKYMPAEIAKIILKNKTLRWSSPLEFNDPFDIPREIAVNISHETLKEASASKFIELIENPPETTDHLDPRIKHLVDATKHKATPEMKEELIRKIRAEEFDPSQGENGLDMLRLMWRQMIPLFRILCLSERYDVISMWLHYADKYKGVVIELLCDDNLDSAWLIAKAVKYGKPKLDLFDASGWAELLVLPHDDRLNMMYDTLTLNQRIGNMNENGALRVLQNMERPEPYLTMNSIHVKSEEFSSDHTSIKLIKQIY